MSNTIDLRFSFQPQALAHMYDDLPYINDYKWEIIPYEVIVDLSIPRDVNAELSSDADLCDEYLNIPSHLLNWIDCINDEPWLT